MVAGISIVNSTGQTQIIHDGINYCFKYKMTINLPNRSAWGDPGYFSFRVNGSARLIVAYRTTIAYIGDMNIVTGSGFKDLKIIYYNASGATQPVTVYIYDRVFDESNYGLVIRNASGAISMTSNNRLLKATASPVTGYAFIIISTGSFNASGSIATYALRCGPSGIQTNEGPFPAAGSLPKVVMLDTTGL